MENLRKFQRCTEKYAKARREVLSGKVKGTRRLGDDDNDLQVSKLLYSENGDQLLSRATKAE